MIVDDSNTIVQFGGDSGDAEITHHTDCQPGNSAIQLRFNADNASERRQNLSSKDASEYVTGGRRSLDLTASGRLKVRMQRIATNYVVTPASSASNAVWRGAAVPCGTSGRLLCLDGAVVETDNYTGGMGTKSDGTGKLEPIVIAAGTETSGNLTVTAFYADLWPRITVTGNSCHVAASDSRSRR